jgi:hypothetical protein
MDLCRQCGSELGIGRFCTNCGHPVDQPPDEASAWRTDTAERPRVVDPVQPLPVSTAPGPARFRLFADEDDALGDDTRQLAPVLPPPLEPFQDEPRDRRTGPPGWVPWVAGAVVMLLVAGFGAWLLFSSFDEDPATARDSRADSTPTEERTPKQDPTPSEPSPTRSADPTPFAGDLAPFADISAPPAAAPGVDANGDLVRYVATNMQDGIPETAWRTPGDGTGLTLTFRFDSPSTLSEVGLVNGYAKVARDGGGILDWYHGNRRLRAVEWTFDDGTVVTQRFEDTTLLQMVAVDKVETRSVTLRLVSVTPPGRGRAARNYTAISEVSFLGRTG